MLATSRDIILRFPVADDERISLELAGNICRCTGYNVDVEDVRSVLPDLAETPDERVESMREAVKANNQSVTKTGQFATFQPEPSSTKAEAPAAGKAPAGSKGNLIESDFDLAYPVSTVWEFMSDLNAVAACLPGAELDEQVGDEVKGRVAIKFGPMSASFKGQATLQRDEQQHSAILKGSGVDSLSNSRARGDVAYSLHEKGPDGTKVKVSLEYSLQG